MEKVLDEYLEKMEKYLKPVSASDRVDIIEEAKYPVITGFLSQSVGIMQK